jgi:hypothetical protein
MASYSDYEMDDRPQAEPVRLRAKVESVIRQGLGDMWLLLDGEEIATEEWADADWRDGQAFAMVSADQVRLLGSRGFALNALRSVGITI